MLIYGDQAKLLLFQNSQMQTLSLDACRDEPNQPQSFAQGVRQKLYHLPWEIIIISQ